MKNLKLQKQLYIYPKQFQSLGFHHRSHYYLKLTLIKNYKNQSPLQIQPHPIVYNFSQIPQHKKKNIDIHGNVTGLKWEVQEKGCGFQSQKFQIQFNDQFVRFGSGCLFKFYEDCQIEVQRRGQKKDELGVTAKGLIYEQDPQSKQFNEIHHIHKQGEKLSIRMELFKYETVIIKRTELIELETPQTTKISQQILVINEDKQMQQQNKVEYRHLFFRSNQYFSEFKFAYLLVDCGYKAHYKWMRQLKYYMVDARPIGEKPRVKSTFVSNVFYQEDKGRGKRLDFYYDHLYYNFVVRKVRIYEGLTGMYNQNMEVMTKTKNRSYQLIGINFDQKKDELPNLSHILTDLTQPQPPNNPKIISQLRQHPSTRSPFQTLLDYYECPQLQLQARIVKTSTLIDNNLRYALEKFIRLIIFVSHIRAREIMGEEAERVRYLGKGVQFGELCMAVGKEQLEKYHKQKKEYVENLLQNMPNYTTSEIPQPSILHTTHTKPKQPLIIKLDSQTSLTSTTAHQTITILIHGYKGSQFDFSRLKHYMSRYLNLSNFYSIKGFNQEQATNMNIDKLAELCYGEVKNYLGKIHFEIRWINFVGFSLGGIIIRAMLPLLEDYKEKFNAYVAFASPQIGINELESCLVNAGIFFMRKVQNIDPIKELYNESSQPHTPSKLHQLSSCPYLKHLKSIFLIGLKNDKYVPTYSSLINYEGDDKKLMRMNDNLNQMMGNSNVWKILVDLDYQEGVWDKLTGRKSHVAVLEDDAFLKYFLVKFQKEISGEFM